MKTRALVSATLALALGAHVAQADDVEQAKAYFKAGATAFSAGQFVAAEQAWAQAYKLSPRPAILFSMAQAERHQYVIDGKPEHVRDAVKNYREYIGKVEQGGRRADAVEALGELEPIFAKLPAESTGDAQKTVVTETKTTRVMISSPTPGAQVSMDGGKAVEAPFIGEVKPGKHRVVVVAEGYFDDQRDVTAIERELVPADVVLKERPAKLTFTGSPGAQISIDGRLIGQTPLTTPLEVAAGTHFVTVTKSGYKSYADEIAFNRGETRTVTASLEKTTQRTASYALLLVGAGGVVAGGIMAGLAAHEQNVAQGILDQSAQQNIKATPDRDNYDSARDARDMYKKVAGVAFGAGAAVAITGLVLYAFDQPAVATPSSRPSDEKGPKPAPKDAPGMDMGRRDLGVRSIAVAPVVMPGLLGGAVGGRF